MPAPYFNHEEQEHVKLLPKALRTHGDLETVAARVEAEVIARYRYTTFGGPRYACQQTTCGWVVTDPFLEGAVQIDDYVYVCLRGFATDAALANALLADALRREIAEVIRWRLARDAKDPGITSDAGGGDTWKPKQYRDDAEDRFPPAFGALLRTFDVRPTSYTL